MGVAAALCMACGLSALTTAPEDWTAAIAQGSLLYRSGAAPLDRRLYPTLGNGYLATLAGADSTYLAGVYTIVGETEPFRARLPGLAALWVKTSANKSHCQARAPTQRSNCGVPGITPGECTAKGCCFDSFSPDPHGDPWCYHQSNVTSCTDPCLVSVATPASDLTWADHEGFDMASGSFLRRGTVANPSHLATRTASATSGDVDTAQTTGTSTLRSSRRVASPSDSHNSWCGEAMVEQRTFAHATRASLLVTQFEINATLCPIGAPQWTITLLPRPGANFSDRPDFEWVSMPATTPNASLHAGVSLGAERAGRLIHAAVASLAPTMSAVEISVVPGESVTHFFPTVYMSDAGAANASTAAAVAKMADAELAAVVASGAANVLAEHCAAVTAAHADARIEVGGNLRLAQLLNASQSALLGSLSPEVGFSTSPGGLSTGGRWTVDGVDTHGGRGYPEGGSSYYGHVFWDADVWMLPAVLPFTPDVAAAMIGYRQRTLPAAMAIAAAEHRNGTKWAWESAYTGASATGADNQEIHLQAGIGLALRQYYRVTQDKAWLAETGWPLLAQIVTFFISRATTLPDSSLALLKVRCFGRYSCALKVSSGGKVGGGHTCHLSRCALTHLLAVKSILFECALISISNLCRGCVLQVQSPNEYAAGIDNDVYTNAAFAAVLEWAAIVATTLGEPHPEQYAALAARVVIPFDAAAGRHAEYTGAPADLRIKQATLTMVPYPVMRPMPPSVQRADLVYEAGHIGDEGPAMTHSMLAIDWLAMGNVSGGRAEFLRAYASNVVGPFNQWMECPLPPDFCQGHRPATNFLTAAGGLLQSVIYGFGGVRYFDHNLTLRPVLLSNTFSLTLRGLRWGGAVLDITATAPMVTVEVRRNSDSDQGLCLTSDWNRSFTPLGVGAAVEVPLPSEVTVVAC